MPSVYITKANNEGCYFVTCTVMHWYYLFDRHNRWQQIADALQYAIKQDRIKLYGFVFMLNHIHLLFSSNDASGFLRDFKKFTSKKLKENIIATEPQVLQIQLRMCGNPCFRAFYETSWKGLQSPSGD